MEPLSHRAAILDKIKWNSKPPSPPPPQIKDEAARRAKTRHFPILDLGARGAGGLGFPFILSKNVGCVSNGEDFDTHSFSKIVIRQMCNLEKGRLGNDLLLVV